MEALVEKIAALAKLETGARGSSEFVLIAQPALAADGAAAPPLNRHAVS